MLFERMLRVSLRSVMNVNNRVVTSHLNSHCHDETHRDECTRTRARARAIDVNVSRII